MKDKTYLFAYGTLREGFDVGVKKEVEKKLVFIETGKVKAKLYDVGFYPAAVRAEDETEVEGDVFEVLDECKTFALLDEYEGEEYQRGVATVKTDSGDKIEAWIYWFKAKPGEHLRIKEKDYRIYLKTKDSLR